MDENTTIHLAHAYVKINGQALQPTEYDALQSVEVDDSLYLPDMFTIVFNDKGLELLTSDKFKPGDTVEIRMRQEGTTESTKLMEGEITSIEPDLNGHDRTMLLLRGYDRSHRLTRERKTKTYLQVMDSDIASQVASGGGLSADAQSTGVVHDYVMQANQTDWEFLQERAQRNGYRIYVEDKTLHFKPADPSPSVATTLDWGVNMDMFRPRLATMDQPSQVTVRGWDPKQKQAIVGQVTSPSSALQYKTDNGTTGGASAQQAFGTQGKQLVVDAPPFSQAEAQKMAQAEMDRLSTKFLTAEGSAGGDPKILAGSAVQIKGVGPRFSTQYTVTRAIHRWSDKGYSVRFWVSASNTTIGEVLKGSNGNGSSGHGVATPKTTYTGIFAGLVTDNDDPEKLGRVKVKIPALGDNIETHWCKLLSFMAGSQRGAIYYPEVNDEVAVMFEHGDPTRGYVIGACWSATDVVPQPVSTPTPLVTGGQTIRRLIKTRLGHEIMLDDSNEATTGIILMDKTSKNFIRIITLQNKIHIECEGDVYVHSTQGNMDVKADMGNITVQASTGNINLKADAGKVAIDGQTGVDITSSAGKVSISGTLGIDENASGGKVSVNGTLGVDVTGAPAPVNIKGLPVNLN